VKNYGVSESDESAIRRSSCTYPWRFYTCPSYPSMSSNDRVSSQPASWQHEWKDGMVPSFVDLALC
jgi:hypothetical protein